MPSVPKGARRNEERDQGASRETAATAYRTLLATIWSSVIAPPLRFLTGLLSDTLFFLRPFLGAALAISIFAMLVWFGVTWTYAQIGGSVGPVASLSCSLPLLSHAPWCHAAKPTKDQASFDNLVNLQDSFGDVLDIAEEGFKLPMAMTKAEFPLLELRDLTKFRSQLPSKDELVLQFDQFVDLSRTTSADLSTFNSHIGGAVDKIISMNRHTLRYLEAVQHEPSYGLISYLGSLLPFADLGRPSSSGVLRQYLQHADLVERQIDALTLEAETLLVSLETMDVKLDEIRETVAHDAANLASSRDKLFATLWTYLGINSQVRAHVNRNIEIADKVRDVRTGAVHVVRAALLELRALKSGIVDLRKRVVAPRTWAAGAVDPWEIEEHVVYVQDGLERLHRKRSEQSQRRQAMVNAMLNHARREFGEGPRSGGLKELPG
jgi:hypothetical protein